MYRKELIMDRVDKDEVNRQPQKKKSNIFRFQVFITPFTDVECDNVNLDTTPENAALMDVSSVISEACSSTMSEVVESETAEKPVEAS